MFKHILAAVDGSWPHSDAVLQAALRLAGLCGEATDVTALLVVPDYTTADVLGVVLHDGPEFETLRRRLAAAGERQLERLVARHAGAERVHRCVMVGDAPYEQIVQTANRLQCDLIVMAARGRGALASALLGSQTSHVLSLSQVPVLVVR